MMDVHVNYEIPQKQNNTLLYNFLRVSIINKIIKNRQISTDMGHRYIPTYSYTELINNNRHLN